MIKQTNLQFTDLSDMSVIHIKIDFDMHILDEYNKPSIRLHFHTDIGEENLNFIFSLDDEELQELIDSLQSFKNGKKFYR